MTQPCFIVAHGWTTDRYNNRKPDWSTAARTAVRGWISQRSAEELLGHRNGEVSEWVGFFPRTAVIRATDRIERFGQTFEVAGPVNPAHTPHAGLHHFEVPLRIVEG